MFERKVTVDMESTCPWLTLLENWGIMSSLCSANLSRILEFRFSKNWSMLSSRNATKSALGSKNEMLPGWILCLVFCFIEAWSTSLRRMDSRLFMILPMFVTCTTLSVTSGPIIQCDSRSSFVSGIRSVFLMKLVVFKSRVHLRDYVVQGSETLAWTLFNYLKSPPTNTIQIFDTKW